MYQFGDIPATEILVFSLIFILLCLLFIFVGFPIIFMNSIKLQRLIIFTNFNLPSEKNYYRKHELKPGLRNFYIPVTDSDTDKKIDLGVWHLLPFTSIDDVITELDYDFDKDLKNTNRSVLLYFHGTGEDRSSSLSKYTVFRYFFHVITFDYRNYGDSAEVTLSEEAVVNDCVQLYEWLVSKTSAPIFIWGHSLGTALSAHTAKVLQTKPNIRQPVGLVLEAAFTRMSEEIKVHPYGKFFAWLPWFTATVIKPLQKNGLIFDTSAYIMNLNYPIMILSSEDDSIVPYRFGKELYEIAKNRTNVNTTVYYQFPSFLPYDHNYIFRNPFLPFFISYFRHLCLGEERNETSQFVYKSQEYIQ